LPTSDEDGARLFVGSLSVLIVFSLVLFGVILVSGESLMRLAAFEGGHTVMLFLPLAIAVSNSNLCLQFWSLRKKEYRKLAVVKGLQSATMATGQIGLGWAHFGTIGLILGHLLGQAAGIVQLAKSVITEHREAFRNIRASEVAGLLWKNRSFITTFTPSALLGAGTIYLPAILLGYIYGPVVAGVFAFALQMSKAGINIIVQSMSKVFLVGSIENFNSGDMASIKHKAIRFALAQFLLGSPVFIALALFGEEIFGIVFGSNWVLGGVYVKLMIPHLMTLFMFEHLTVLFVVTGSHKAKLIWDILKFLVLLITFAIARAIDLSPESFILILSCGWGVLHFGLIPITFRSLGRDARILVDRNEAA